MRFVAVLALAGCLSKAERLAIFDDDGDGFHTSFSADHGGEPPWDCDDERADVFPGADEVCDGVDGDCDGEVDDGVTIEVYGDVDGDGFGVAAVTDVACAPGDGWAAVEGDCDDADALVFPGADDVCNGVDDDCDGTRDDGGTPIDVWVDADGDGWGAGDPLVDCRVTDGFAVQDGDCADGDAARNPGVTEVWYDGVDGDCDGADDYDADGDAHRSDDHGGDDCRDDDATTYAGAPEGPWDLTRDNDCDGLTTDPVVIDLDDVQRIDGVGDRAWFGFEVVATPAGWIDAEPTLLVSAYREGNYRGVVYGYSLADLQAATTSDDATFSITGPDNAPSPFNAGFGFHFAWLGDATTPLVAVTASSVDGGRGRIYLWDGPELVDGLSAARAEIAGDTAMMIAGGPTLSDADVDGDGVADLVTSSVHDPVAASQSGSIAVFFDPAALSGAVSYRDADAVFTRPVANLEILPVALGDVDEDGADDLGVVRGDGNCGPSWVVVDVASGDADVTAIADITLTDSCGALRVQRAPDGTRDLIAFGGTGGQARRFDLPASGTLQWTQGQAGILSFATSGLEWTATSWFPGTHVIAGGPGADGNRGALAASVWPSASDVALDSALVVARGEFAGDRFAERFVRLDVDADEVDDLVVAAHQRDGSTSDNGAIYVIPGGR